MVIISKGGNQFLFQKTLIVPFRPLLLDFQSLPLFFLLSKIFSIKSHLSSLIFSPPTSSPLSNLTFPSSISSQNYTRRAEGGYQITWCTSIHITIISFKRPPHVKEGRRRPLSWQRNMIQRSKESFQPHLKCDTRSC